MSYNFRDRIGYIGKRQNAVRGEKILYARGAAQITLYAVPGHTDVQDLVPENVITVARYVDFIISAADLKLPGLGITLPIRGDKITWEGNIYIATPPQALEDCYNFTTMYRDRLRVHTVLTALAATPT